MARCFFKALVLSHPPITESESEQVETLNRAILEQKGSLDQLTPRIPGSWTN